MTSTRTYLQPLQIQKGFLPAWYLRAGAMHSAGAVSPMLGSYRMPVFLFGTIYFLKPNMRLSIALAHQTAENVWSGSARG